MDMKLNPNVEKQLRRSNTNMNTNTKGHVFVMDM